MNREEKSSESGLIRLLLLPLLISALRAPLWATDPPVVEDTVSGILPASQIQVLELPPLDNQKLLERAEKSANSDGPYQFAEPREVEVSPAKDGTWEALGDGERMWRLRIVSPGSVSINLGFTRYKMPEGGTLLLYTRDLETVIGPFTHEDNEEHGQLWTPPLPGEEIVIEVILPAERIADLDLLLGRVNHGYMDVDGSRLKNTNGLHVDVACPEAEGWEDEIRSVVVFSFSGKRYLTGFLVNNTALDNTPYLITAYHSQIDPEIAPSLVVYWNFENSYCRAVNSLENAYPGDGRLDRFNTGTIYRAGYEESDFILLELDDPIDPEVNPYFAGWDVTGATSTNAVCIHHPCGEEKRISLSYSPTTTLSGGCVVRVHGWDLGATEVGSSGSPLFNQDHHAVGQAWTGGEFGGTYGSLSCSWTGGGTPDTRLMDWLDPNGVGVTVLDGINQGPSFTLRLTPSVMSICAPDDAVFDIVVGSVLGFSEPVQLSVSGFPVGVDPVFEPDAVVPPGTSRLTLSNTIAAIAGSYQIKITGTALRSRKRSVWLNLARFSPDPTDPLLPANGANDVELFPTFAWTRSTRAWEYLLEVATDPEFAQTVYSAVVSATGYVPDSPLAVDSTYYWRVTPQNACGLGGSPVFSFTTTDVSCSSLPPYTPRDFRSDTDEMVLAHNDPIQDLDVRIHLEHSYFGDLVITLEHVDTGTSVDLLDRPGVYPGTASCGGNSEITFDDEAEVLSDGICSEGAVPDSFSVQPTTGLGAFDGEDPEGTWRLSVSDDAFEDTGIVSDWCLLQSFDESPAPSPTPTAIPSATSTPVRVVELTCPRPGGGGEFGSSVSGTPDINGDGLDDVVVGAPMEDILLIGSGSQGRDVGRVYVLDGVSGTMIYSVLSPQIQRDRRFGTAVSGVPDTNGNRYGEVVVAQPHGSGGGRAFLLDGSNGLLLHVLAPPQFNNGNDFAGAVSGVPDVNGDGFGDVLVGAHGEGAGRAYIFDGSSGLLLHNLASPNPSNGEFGRSVSGISDVNGDDRGDAIVGENGGAHILDGSTISLLHSFLSPTGQVGFGSSVAEVPDMNGDARPDVVVGNPNEASDGRAYIFDGSTGALLQTIDSNDIYGGSSFGAAVSGIADVNGNGTGDVVIGAPEALNTGRAYVFDGSTGELLEMLFSPSAEENGQFGCSVGGISDLNGDGRGEVLVGARLEDLPGKFEDAGRAYLFQSPFIWVPPPEIEWSPPSLEFGERDLADGPSDLLSITLANRGEHDLVFTSEGITLSGPDSAEFAIAIATDTTPLLPSATRVIAIAFDPASVGAKEAILAITTNDPFNPLVHIQLTGTGTFRGIEVSSLSLDFGDQEIDGGHTDPMTVLIQNEGSRDLHFTGAGVEITGDGADDFLIMSDPDITPISPHGTRELAVLFDPSSIGERGAYLTITTDDPDDPLVNVILYGVGKSGSAFSVLRSPKEERSGAFGCSVSGIPDVNGDERGDIVVGAYRENPGDSPNDCGRVYIFDGSTNVLLHVLSSPNEEASGGFGTSVSGIPDVNGNGYGEVVVGAPQESHRFPPLQWRVEDGGNGHFYGLTTRPDTWHESNAEAVSYGGYLASITSASEKDFIVDWVLPGGNVWIGLTDVQWEGRFAWTSGEPFQYTNWYDGEPNNSNDEDYVHVYSDGTWNDQTPARSYYGLIEWSSQPTQDAPGIRWFGVGQAYVMDVSTGTLLHSLLPPVAKRDGHFGEVAGVPDTNGNGFWDVVVGENRGAYIFDGASGTLLHTLTSPNADPSDSTTRSFGSAVSGVPDLNGDGLGDVIVGAAGEYEEAGRAYIFDGFSGELLQTLVSPNAEERGRFGYSVSGIPDLNGDGRGDVIVGAANENQPEVWDWDNEDAGRAYIFDGLTGALLETLVSPNIEQYGQFGCDVSAIPDATGDGRGDVVVGAYGEGRAYIFASCGGTLLETLVSPNGDARGSFGCTVSGIPDVNDDGLGDVVVGAYQEELPGGPSNAGRAYVFHSPFSSPNLEVSPKVLAFGYHGVPDGPTSPQSVTIRNHGSADLHFTGVGIEITGSASDEFEIVSPLDLTPMVPGATRGILLSFDPSSAGEKMANLTITTDDYNHPTLEVPLSGFGTDPDLTFLTSPHQEEGGNFGVSVSGVPDLSGDGLGGVIVGAGGEDENAGRVYIYDGSSQDLLNTLVSPNAEEGGRFGESVSGVPDMSGDGYGDVIVGAPGEDQLGFVAWRTEEGGNGHFYGLTTKAGTWQETDAEAVYYGGYLVSITSASEEAFLSGQIYGTGPLWIGLTDEEEEGSFKWSSGEPVEFTDWDSGEPNNMLEEDYVHVWGDGTWNDSDPYPHYCGIIEWESEPDAYRYHVMTRDSGQVYVFDGSSSTLLRGLISPDREAEAGFGASVSGVPDLNGDGQGDVLVGAGKKDLWIPPIRWQIENGGNGHFYGVTVNPGIWHEVNSEAISYGGYLVSITSASEQAFVFNNLAMGLEVWIGLTDEEEEGVYKWTTGEPLTYTNWAPGNPGNDDEDHIHFFHGGTWNDDQYYNERHGIIEWDSQPHEDTLGLVLHHDAGRVYVFDGATGVLLYSLLSPNAETEGNFGNSVSGVQDVNGDGFGDVVVGAVYEDPFDFLPYAGRAYIFDGLGGALLHTLMTPSFGQNHGYFGDSVSGIPDVNGDGRGDVIVGASGLGSNDAGQAFIFDGSSGMLLRILASPEPEDRGHFGESVSGIPDLNNDDRGDVIVGAAGEGPADEGRAYIFDGSSGALLQTLVSNYEQAGGFFGGGVSGIPDANGDSRGDVIVGALGEHPGLGLEDAGRAYIFYSPFGQVAVRTADLNHDSRINCIDLLEFLRQYRNQEGSKATGSGDLNQDECIDDWDLFLFQYQWAPGSNSKNPQILDN